MSSSPFCKALSNAQEMAAIPDAVTTAASAPSSAAIFSCATVRGGLASRLEMYAWLLPSAHSFISSVEEKVKVDVRQMFVPTGPPTPWRFGSPAWTERVCGPHFSVLEFFMVLELLAFTAMPGKHHFGVTRRGLLGLVVGALIGVGFMRG